MKPGDHGTPKQEKAKQPSADVDLVQIWWSSCLHFHSMLKNSGASVCQQTNSLLL